MLDPRPGKTGYGRTTGDDGDLEIVFDQGIGDTAGARQMSDAEQMLVELEALFAKKFDEA